MAHPIPDDVPLPSSGFDIGVAYLFEIEEAILSESTTGKAMVNLTFRCLEPSPGQMCFEHLTIGNDKDPQGEDPQQLLGNNFYRLLIECLRQAKVKVAGTTLEKALVKAVGAHVGIVFRLQKDKRDGTDRTRPVRFFSEGAMEPGTSASPAGGTTAKPKAATPPKAIKKAAPPPGDDDDDDDEAPPPPPKAKKKPAAPPPDDDDEDDDDD